MPLERRSGDLGRVAFRVKQSQLEFPSGNGQWRGTGASGRKQRFIKVSVNAITLLEGTPYGDFGRIAGRIGIFFA